MGILTGEDSRKLRNKLIGLNKMQRQTNRQIEKREEKELCDNITPMDMNMEL